MTERNRFLLKQFAGEASNNGVFGSYEAGTPTVSDDPTAIQSLPAYETGWEDATTSGSKLPRLEEMQGLQKLFCQAIKELYSEGIPLWMAGETYYLNSLCVYFDENNDFGLYKNITGNNGNNIPPIDTTNWVKLVVDGADKDLSNLSSTGKNIANWSTNVSNCITEIPQDIKLELDNGTLTLKAGSKLYVPNGAGVFDEIVISNDIIIPGWTNNAQGMLSIKPSASGIWISLMNQQYSGSTTPTSSQYELWYDTDSNKVKTTSNTGSTWTDGYSLPIALITSNGSSWTSIDQIFNGFGYIGSTVFALPGVKGLIPDGRNEDGSLKSIEFNIDRVETFTNPDNYSSNQIITYNTNGLHRDNVFYNQDSKPNFVENSNQIWYNPATNKTFYYRNSSDNYFINSCLIGNFSNDSSSRITSFTPKTVFHAVDYNDTEFIASQSTPSDRYIDLVLAASGNSYTAQATGWIMFSKQSTSTQQYVELGLSNSVRYRGSAIADDSTCLTSLYVSKGQKFYVTYNAGGNTNFFRFIYAKGSK